jgi:ech hydrogenase subunit D
MESKTVTQAELQAEAKRLKASDARLITIVGQDCGTNIEVLYFFYTGIKKSEVFRISVPKSEGGEEVESITPIFPAAFIAENEAAEMFDLKIKGIPGHFFLPDGIKAPLRRK